MQTIQLSADAEDPTLREIAKIKHLFPSGEFMLCARSSLPLLSRGPVQIPNDRPFVCLFGNPFSKNLSAAHDVFRRLEARLMNPDEDFTLEEMFCVETVAHKLRYRGVLSGNAAMLSRASELYRAVLLAYSFTPLTSIVMDIPRMTNKVMMVTPAPGIEQFSVTARRGVVHCLAGMALCALMGRDVLGFFGLSSAALSWELGRPVELAGFLRLNMALVSKFKLGLRLAHDGQWEFLVPSAIDAIMDPLLPRTLKVYEAFTKQLVLPAVLRHGSPAMLQQERDLIGPAEWDQAHSFAQAILRRIQDRAAGTIPTPDRLTRVHIVDGQIVERRCGGCGVWQAHSGGRRLECCGKCRQVYYCGKECQSLHWPEHKASCKKA